MRNNYLRWLFKSRKMTILFFTVVYVVFLYTPYLGDNTFSRDYWSFWSYLYTKSLGVGIGMSVFLAIVLPIILFSYMHHKRSVDVYLALPVSRRRQLLSSLFFTWLLSYGWFALGTLLIWILKGQGSFELLSQWGRLQPWMLFSLAVLIAVTTALYMCANNVFDGVVMILAYNVLPVCITLVSELFVNNMVAGYDYAGIFSSLDIGKWFSPLFMAVSNSSHLLDGEEMFSWAYFWMLLIYGALAIVGLRFAFVKRKSERAEQISNSFFAYPFVINAYAMLILLAFAFAVVSGSSREMFLFYTLLFFAYIIASFIYRRSLKISWRPIVSFLVMVVISLGFSFAAWKTAGFGLAYVYHPQTSRYIVYNYQADVDSENLGMWREEDKDWEETAAVQFTLIIPTDRLQEKQEIVSLLEDKRKESIAAFYDERIDKGYYGNLRISGRNRKEDNYMDEQRYNYSLPQPLSETELKMIARYCKVEVSLFTEGEYVPLDQFLSTRE